MYGIPVKRITTRHERQAIYRVIMQDCVGASRGIFRVNSETE